MRSFTVFLFLITIIFSCTDNKDDYLSEINKWKMERLDELTAPISWSSLSGLYWVNEGENTLGSSKEANLRFPDGAPERIATIFRSGDSLTLIPQEGIEISLGDQSIQTSVMQINKTPDVSRYNTGQYFYTAIQRNEKIGLRIWDTLHHARDVYKDLPYYPVDKSYNVKAQFIPYNPVKNTTLKNILGMEIKQEIPGRLEFELKGNKYSLEPLNSGEDEFFIIFEDETTGGDTYGGGRYLYCPKPDADGTTYIDFNKAHTPPCGFTAFATCLLPPKENIMPLELTAGEKYNEGH